MFFTAGATLTAWGHAVEAGVALSGILSSLAGPAWRSVVWREMLAPVASRAPRTASTTDNGKAEHLLLTG